MRKISTNWQIRIGTLSAHVIISLQGFLLIPIIIKNAGADSYGLYVLVSAFVSLFLGVSPLGTNVFVRRNLVKLHDRESRGKLLSQVMFLQISIASIIYIILLLSSILNFVNPLETSLLTITFFILMPYILFNSLADGLRYSDNVTSYNFLTVSFPVFLTLLAFIYVIFVPNPETMGFLVCMITALFLTILTCWRFVSPIVKPVFVTYRWEEFKQHVAYGWPLMVAFISEFLLGTADRYIIGGKLGLEAVGIYSAAFSVGALVFVIPKVLNVITLPRALVMHQSGDDLGGEDANARCIVMLILGFFPFLIGCNFFSKDILSILANPETADAGYYVVSVIGAAFFFQGVTLICTQFYFVDDKIKSTLHIYLFVAFINISLNFLILEHTTSLAGPASASLISSIICAGLAIRLLSPRQYRLILKYVVVAIPQVLFPCAVLAAAAMGLNLILSKADDIQPLIVFSKIGICAIAYLGALFLNPKTRLFLRDL